MLLDGLLPSTERMLPDFIPDLRLRIAHADGRVGVAGRHLRLWALQRREELGVQQRRLGVLEPRGGVACQAEVGVLVDRAGDEARDVGFCPEDLGEGVREGRRGLDGAEVDLADVVTDDRPVRCVF